MFPGQFFSVLGCPLLSRVHSEVHPNRMACANNLLKRKFGNIRELEMHKLKFLFLVQDTCVRLGLWGDICQGGHFSKNCPLKGKCRQYLESSHMARDCKNPPKSWGARVSSGGIAVKASGTAEGAAAGVLDPTPAEASGRGPSSELQPLGSNVSRSWGSVMDMRDNELSPPSFGEGLVANDTIRNLVMKVMIILVIL